MFAACSISIDRHVDGKLECSIANTVRAVILRTHGQCIVGGGRNVVLTNHIVGLGVTRSRAERNTATPRLEVPTVSIMASLRYATRITATRVIRPLFRHTFRQSKRKASFYNADVAGLTEEETEVRFDMNTELNQADHAFMTLSRQSSEMRSRSLHRRRLHLEQQKLTKRTPSQWSVNGLVHSTRS
jgi:hypothetical protein